MSKTPGTFHVTLADDSSVTVYLKPPNLAQLMVAVTTAQYIHDWGHEEMADVYSAAADLMKWASWNELLEANLLDADTIANFSEAFVTGKEALLVLKGFNILAPMMQNFTDALQPATRKSDWGLSHG